MKRIERFDKYMKYRGLNDNKVTVQAGLSSGTIAKSRGENRDLSDKALEKIGNFYKDLNVDWVITGSGEMLNQNVQSNNNIVGNSNNVNDSTMIAKILQELANTRKQVNDLIEIVKQQMEIIKNK